MDNGRNFEGELFRSFCKLLEKAKICSNPYHPAGNGQCEVFNKIILQMIRAYLSRVFKEWDVHIPHISMSLYSMKNHWIDYSANMLMLGRKTINPIDLMLGIHSNSPQSPSERLSTAHRSAREATELEQFRQKRNYDLIVLENSYGVGDVVYLRDNSTKVGVSSKLRPPFIGPYHHHIIIGFFINVQVQGHHPHQWAPF